MAGVDVPVDTIVGSRDLATWKPGPIGVTDATSELLGGLVEDGVGLPVPVELLGMAGPEGLGVRERGVLDLILEGHNGRGTAWDGLQAIPPSGKSISNNET